MTAIEIKDVLNMCTDLKIIENDFITYLVKIQYKYNKDINEILNTFNIKTQDDLNTLFTMEILSNGKWIDSVMKLKELNKELNIFISQADLADGDNLGTYLEINTALDDTDDINTLNINAITIVNPINAFTDDISMNFMHHLSKNKKNFINDLIKSITAAMVQSSNILQLSTGLQLPFILTSNNVLNVTGRTLFIKPQISQEAFAFLTTQWGLPEVSVYESLNSNTAGWYSLITPLVCADEVMEQYIPGLNEYAQYRNLENFVNSLGKPIKPKYALPQDQLYLLEETTY